MFKYFENQTSQYLSLFSCNNSSENWYHSLIFSHVIKNEQDKIAFLKNVEQTY